MSKLIGSDLKPEYRIGSPSPLRPHKLELGGSAEPVAADHRTGAGVNRQRPLRRRLFSTRIPPGVDMRARNPCTFLR
jgi:hypothetical protein